MDAQRQAKQRQRPRRHASAASIHVKNKCSRAQIDCEENQLRGPYVAATRNTSRRLCLICWRQPAAGRVSSMQVVQSCEGPHKPGWINKRTGASAKLGVVKIPIKNP
eukprot:1219314-Pleurochrysis_carterae.AAC.1